MVFVLITFFSLSALAQVSPSARTVNFVQKVSEENQFVIASSQLAVTGSA
jgi:hypothetical protein